MKVGEEEKDHNISSTNAKRQTIVLSFSFYYLFTTMDDMR
ncbi:hypothetical protein LINPERHAP2_LOCUS24421 [Linum perenne]